MDDLKNANLVRVVDGREIQILDDKDQIRYIFWEGLTKLGWQTVVNEVSGLYWKNGFLLSIFRTKPDTRKERYGNAKANAYVYNKVSRISWQLEHYGALLDSGRINTTLSYVFVSGRYDDETYQNLLNKFDGYTKLGNFELMSKKKIEIKTEVPTEKVGLHVSDKDFMETMSFMLVSEIPGLMDQFRLRVPYKLFLSSSKTLMAMPVSADGRQSGTAFPLSDQTRRALLGAVGVDGFVVLEYGSYLGIENKIELAPMSDSAYAYLPQEIYDLNLPKWQNMLISEGIAKRYNILPLLRTDLSKEAVQGIFNLLAVSTEYSCMMAAPNDKDILQHVVQAAKNGFSIFKYLQPGNTVMSVQTMIQEDVANFDSIVTDLRKQYDLSAITALKFFSTSSFSQFTIEKSYTSFHVGLARLLKLGIMPETSKGLLADGVCSQYVIYFSKSNLSFDMKAELRALFAAPDYSLKGEPWTEVYDKLLLVTNYIAYCDKFGFLLSTKNGIFGRCLGGFFCLSLKMDPIYYAIQINGKYVEYMDNEKFAAFLDII